MKGVVTSTQTKVSIDSQIICTGEVRPNSTVSVEASWPKGSPEDICYKESSFGKTLDWSKCEMAMLLGSVPAVLPVKVSREDSRRGTESKANWRVSK